MSNTDFEAPDGEAPSSSEEYLLDPTDPSTEAEGQNVGPDAGDEGHEDAQAGGSEEVAPRRNRANDTIRELRSRAQEERTHRERLEREIMEIRAAQQAARQQPTPEQEAERLAMMNPEERSEYKMNKALAEIRREQALTNFQNQDRSDKALFDAKALNDKVFQRYAAKVESERVRYMRELNMVIPREQPCYPRSVLPAEKFEKGGESR